MSSFRSHFFTKGFTVVEILIVITVIGILAGIILVNYNSSRNRANDVTVQDDLEAMSGQLEDYKTSSELNLTYPPDKPALQTLNMHVTKSAYDTSIAVNVLYCVSSDRTTYALVARSKSGNFFEVTQDGIQNYTLGLAAFLNTSTICAAINSNLTFVSNGWNSSDQTTGPWRAWVGGN